MGSHRQPTSLVCRLRRRPTVRSTPAIGGRSWPIRVLSAESSCEKIRSCERNPSWKLRRLRIMRIGGDRRQMTLLPGEESRHQSRIFSARRMPRRLAAGDEFTLLIMALPAVHKRRLFRCTFSKNFDICRKRLHINLRQRRNAWVDGDRRKCTHGRLHGSSLLLSLTAEIRGREGLAKVAFSVLPSRPCKRKSGSRPRFGVG
mmetsp:Transcript_176739/g.566873  ORF Transcript_176739/g.566873 Transcript_176739/m.566873 type:complete len:202 (-) Transcript_176739:202-807(-)